jgi:hypothetical protein
MVGNSENQIKNAIGRKVTFCIGGNVNAKREGVIKDYYSCGFYLVWCDELNAVVTVDGMNINYL